MRINKINDDSKQCYYHECKVYSSKFTFSKITRPDNTVTYEAVCHCPIHSKEYLDSLKDRLWFEFIIYSNIEHIEKVSTILIPLM
jgi:hypothetical protein